MGTSNVGAGLADFSHELTAEQVRERLRDARARGRPFFPWPDLAPASWRESLVAIQAATAELLRRENPGEQRPGRTAAPVVLRVPAGGRALGVAAFTSGMGPLLGLWLERGDLVVADGGDQLRLHLEHGRRRAERLRLGLVGVGARMAARGVTPTVVKGFHTAHAFFPEPGTRPLADVDLVIAPGEVPAASRALEESGFAARQVLERPYMCEWTAPGSPSAPRSLELTHAENPWSVDLHATFDRDLGGIRRVPVVPAGEHATEPWRMAGAEVSVLVEPYLTAYLALHASQELRNLTLVRLVELVWVVRAGTRRGTLAWDGFMDLLARSGALPFVYPALSLAERLAPGTVPADVVQALGRRAPPRARDIASRLEPATAQRLESVALREHFMWATTPIDYLRRMRRVLWPEWAGSVPARLRVQAGRLRQLTRRQVALDRPHRDA